MVRLLRLLRNPPSCHSERSEESGFSPATQEPRSLALLGMTGLELCRQSGLTFRSMTVVPCQLLHL